MSGSAYLLLILTSASLYRGSGGGVLELIFTARPVVKLVLLVLLLFSVVSWAIIFFKFKTLRKADAETREFLRAFSSRKELSAIYLESRRFRFSPLFEIFRAGYIELKQLKSSGSVGTESPEFKDMIQPGIVTKAERAARQAHSNQITRLERNLSFLATTGNSAPFIGLFGTVWGIMEAFHDIGQKGATSLAIVAPGISEALIATAVGLFAAIPAVIAYNYFLSRIRRVVSQMDNFLAEFLSLFER
jgi:biopolymer transport protein TolQ